MPEYATFHNTIFDRKCSKCKKTQDPIYFTQHGKVYKTCNECRDRDRTRRACRFRDNLSPDFLALCARVNPRQTDTDTDVSSDDDPGQRHLNPVDSLIAQGFNYNDINAALVLSSSSAAAASSSAAADYFVDEPEPEPEPDESEVG